ncbi:unnamed protein product [Nippostrongylus brasiliensis]|uniref:DDE_3 domain-containing protein n=1 Tax=Nippostrongylus brasiliensis TaxID=27835 RepID=A0A0N4XUY4_NIPBR|nr:unnamed protein product [Nippostrongylus brasiliensis]
MAGMLLQQKYNDVICEQVLGKEHLLRFYCSFSVRRISEGPSSSHKRAEKSEGILKEIADVCLMFMWPSHSPDLNPMDYAIWSIMESKACATYHKDIASLRQVLEKAWEGSDEEVLRAAVEAFPEV